MNVEGPEYLLNYLMHEDSDEPVATHIEQLKIELDHHIYSYGNQFRNPKETRVDSITLKERLRKLYAVYSSLYLNHYSGDKTNVLSVVYFRNFNQHLENNNIYPLSPCWSPIGKRVAGNKELIRAAKHISGCISEKPFSFLVGSSFRNDVSRFNGSVFDFLSKTPLKAAFLYTDQYFYSKVTIDAFKKMQRPSFILSHGLPGIYDKCCDNRSDYLLVWGEKIKQNYVKAGFKEDKVFVVGHPAYNAKEQKKDLRFDFTDIVVLPKAMSGHQHTYSTIQVDRGNMIVYLLQVKNVLKKLGITKARLRPHPTMNTEWLFKFLGNDFYIADTLSLSASLNRATLVIGPVSTLLLEASFHGVNFAAYEPQHKKKDILGYDIVPPFDGSDPNIPVARSEDDLLQLLKSREGVNTAFLNDYLAPFDISFVKHMI
jgi:hypothetical protein